MHILSTPHTAVELLVKHGHSLALHVRRCSHSMRVLPSQMWLLTKAVHELSCPGSAPVMLMDEPVTQPAPKVGCDKHGQVGGCFGTSRFCQIGMEHLQTM